MHTESFSPADTLILSGFCDTFKEWRILLIYNMRNIRIFQNKIKIDIPIALTDTSFVEKMAGTWLWNAVADFYPLPLFWFPREVINVHLQDSGMLKGRLRFLLEFLFGALISAPYLGRNLMGKSSSFGFNIHTSTYLLIKLKVFWRLIHQTSISGLVDIRPWARNRSSEDEWISFCPQGAQGQVGK